jgi:hypothetical protein
MTAIDSPDLLPPPSRVARARAARRAARNRTGRPLGGHAAPFPVTALLWAAAAAGHAAPGVANVVAFAAPVIAVVWWWKWSRRRTREQRRARYAHALAVTVAAHAWLWWATQAGAGGWRAVALWAGMVAILQPYWARRRIPVPPETVEPVAVVANPLGVTGKWAERVQAPGGALPGAALTRHQRVVNGDAWDIQLIPGVQTTEDVFKAQCRIVSAFDDLTADQVILDRHPSGSMAKARLTVIEGHPLNRTMRHPGPEQVLSEYHDTGYVHFGEHPDGQPARWGFFIPGWGLAPGFVVGSIGSGKSKLLLNLATAACHTGHLSVWAACPVGGQSYPDLIRNASWPATDIPEIMLQLEAMVRIIGARGLVNNLRGWDLHVPTRDEPGVLLFLDEFHKLTQGRSAQAKRATFLLSTIAREGRKAAVGIIGADQGFDLDGVFGNDDELRTNLRIKNLWVGRTPSDVLKGMITGISVNPALLPEFFPDGSPTSGLGYLIGHRTAPSRAWHPGGAADLLNAAPKLELEKVGAQLAGDAYLTRVERALASKAKKAAAVVKMDPALLGQILEANPDLRDALAQAGEYTGDPLADLGFAALDVDQAAAEVAEFEGTSFGPAPRFEYEEPEQVGPRNAREAVLDLLRDGPRRKGELMDLTGYAEATVRGALDDLQTEGRIARPRHGIYELAAVAA